MSTPQLNTPFNNPREEEVTEIKVTDPSHPLFGRRFSLLSLSSPQQGDGHVIVAYREQITLRIPIWATNLVPLRPTSQTKLTLEAVSELITLAEQCEVICPTNPKRSGPVCHQKSKPKLLTN